MIEFRKGDIFLSGAQVLVNPVNCMGVSGKGLALEFAKRFPVNQKIYRDYCDEGVAGHMVPGALLLCREVKKNAVIFNVATKNHWKDPSKIEWIISCLDAIVFHTKHFNIRSIAIPALGCGNGKLEWHKIKRIMEDMLQDLNTDVYIYEPHE